ncbi:hypothetical protein XENORESO_013819 [Xenotaenia resolanae]|uniref:Uncharacterized protein n=1 Tax=Xenotaenia resolanae TaxID=208358 RepID=A0ABV0W2T7_9TELE
MFSYVVKRKDLVTSGHSRRIVTPGVNWNTSDWPHVISPLKVLVDARCKLSVLLWDGVCLKCKILDILRLILSLQAGIQSKNCILNIKIWTYAAFVVKWGCFLSGILN